MVIFWEKLEQDEMKEEIVKVMVNMAQDARDIVVKGFSALKEYQIEKEVIVEKTVEETDFQKIVKEEAGADGSAEVIEKSFEEQILEARKELNK